VINRESREESLRRKTPHAQAAIARAATREKELVNET
jgi:hypothetical protein